MNRKHHWSALFVGLAFAACDGCYRPAQAPVAQPKSTSVEADVEPTMPAVVDPVYDSPFRNTQPGVQYIAEERCAECHAEIAAAFRQHPMGQSLEPVDVARELARAPLPPQPIPAGEYEYEVVTQGTELWHREHALSASGERLQTIEHPVAYAVGAGNGGRSYLIRRGEHLLMSPLTWYPGKQRWDLSPGYERNNSHFYRPVIGACLYCHAGQTTWNEETRNHYGQPMFVEHAIGCQRCHGPGELHDRKQRAGVGTGENDDSIVNPARLDAHLAADVCSQCHLGGIARVAAAGRKFDDYRPGLKLSDFLAVYVDRDATRAKFVGHVEQMQTSGCFVGTKGELRCTSCHDPHRAPAAEDRVAYFRARCLRCHTTEKPCHELAETRQQTTPPDNCISCHMPEQATEIQHAAVTDHRVPRRRGNPADEPSKPAAKKRLAPFDRAALARPGFAVSRNLALATVQAWDYAESPVSKDEILAVIRLLEPSVVANPADHVARETLAIGYERLGEHAAAAEQFRKVLATCPGREFSQSGAARNLLAVGRYADAAAHWERAVAVNPWMPLYRAEWGLAVSKQQQWEQCRDITQTAVDLFPDSLACRQLLVESLLGLKEPERAGAEFAELLRLTPERAPLEKWYQAHPLRKGTAP